MIPEFEKPSLLKEANVSYSGASQPAGAEDQRARDSAELREEIGGLKSVNSMLGQALKGLTLQARTTGGTAGPDAALMDACEKAEHALSLGGIGRAYMVGADAVEHAEQLGLTHCACGDAYPSTSYGAGFIDGSGMCPNCDAAIPARDIPAAPASEIERLEMQLIACGVVSMANTPDSAAKAREMHPDYMSVACRDVMRAVDREIALRAQRDALLAALEYCLDSLGGEFALPEDCRDEARAAEAERDKFRNELRDEKSMAASVRFAPWKHADYKAVRALLGMFKPHAGRVGMERAAKEAMTEVEALQGLADTLRRAGHALDLTAGSDLTREVLPAIERLRKDAERYQLAMAEVIRQVDGNIRETVRDCVNGSHDVQDIYDYCDLIEEAICAALAAKESGQ